MSKSHANDKTKHTKLAWVVTLTASLFFFYTFIQMNLFNSINTQLREAFQLDAVGIGQLFSMFFYANVAFLFIAGTLLDRYSPRKLLIMAVSISVIGSFIFALSTTYACAASGRFLIGVGAAFCFLSAIRIASRWFAPGQMALVTGIIVTMAMLGGLVAQTPFTFLVAHLENWRTALLLDASLGVVVLLAIIFTVQDFPPDSGLNVKSHREQLNDLGVWRCMKLAALNPQNWLGGIYTALMNLPVFVLGGLWGILYLTEVHHLTMQQASYVTTIFFVGVIVGSPVFGWVSDHMERRITPMIVGAVLSLLLIGLLMLVSSWSLMSLLVLFFLIGFTTSSQVLSYPTIAELNPSYLTSTAVSIDSFCIMASGFIVPPFFGWLMQRHSVQDVASGITTYSANDFNHAMLIMPVAFIIALTTTFLMRETFCKAVNV